MKPVFSIQADGKDITTLINDRLLLMRTTDKPGLESDEFELRIDARDGAVALPARGRCSRCCSAMPGSPEPPGPLHRR
jgi:phage protein D